MGPIFVLYYKNRKEILIMEAYWTPYILLVSLLSISEALYSFPQELPGEDECSEPAFSRSARGCASIVLVYF